MLLRTALKNSNMAPEQFVGRLSPNERKVLFYLWEAYARPEQIPDRSFAKWLYMGGRGTGKTKSGAEETRREARLSRVRIALVGSTAADVRDTMIEGEAGLLSVCPPWNKPIYIPSKRKVQFPNGSAAYCYSAEEPDQLRGPAHHFAWADELAKWKYAEDTWANLMMGLRLGTHPRAVITTTPRPIKIIKDLISDKTCQKTHGTTYDNKENLASAFFDYIIKKYEGTRLGRQELMAELLEDNPNALFNRKDIHANRLMTLDRSRLLNIVTAIDPAVTSGESSADTGIITVGEDDQQHYYVLLDSTVHDTPSEWAKAAIKAYHNEKGDMIVGETNNGGDMIETVLRGIRWPSGSNFPAGDQIPYGKVTATRGKRLRAEPVSMLSEQGRLHMVGNFPELEDQMCQWDPGELNMRVDRLDAMVWAVRHLMENSMPRVRIVGGK